MKQTRESKPPSISILSVSLFPISLHVSSFAFLSKLLIRFGPNAIFFVPLFIPSSISYMYVGIDHRKEKLERKVAKTLGARKQDFLFTFCNLFVSLPFPLPSILRRYFLLQLEKGITRRRMIIIFRFPSFPLFIVFVSKSSSSLSHYLFFPVFPFLFSSSQVPVSNPESKPNSSTYSSPLLPFSYSYFLLSHFLLVSSLLASSSIFFSAFPFSPITTTATTTTWLDRSLHWTHTPQSLLTCN